MLSTLSNVHARPSKQSDDRPTSIRVGLCLISLSVFLLLEAATLPAANAQDFDKPTPSEGVERLKDILVITQEQGQLVQDVPLPTTTFNGRTA